MDSQLVCFHIRVSFPYEIVFVHCLTRFHRNEMTGSAEMRNYMNKIVKGAVTAIATTGIVMSIPSNFAIAQAPTQSVLSVSEPFSGAEGEVELIPNPIYRSSQSSEASIQAFAVQDSAKKKIAALAESRSLRVKAEKLYEEKLRKKRLAEKKRKQEEKRRKEIQACCGVAAGTKDCQILERIVEAEAGGENFTGKVLVANVILNRVKSKSFPSTIEAVVFAHSGSRYQFSPISDGRYYEVTVSQSTKKAVRSALNGNDPSKGALYFMERSYADSSNVRWFDQALTKLFRYGCHEFYK